MPTPHRSDAQTPLLVVADANPGRCKELESLLRTAGFRVRAAADEAALRDAVRGEAPDLVLVDPGLGGRGVALARELCGGAGTAAGAPVLALVTRETLDRLDVLDIGAADDWVELPPHGALLERRVRTALRQAEALAGALLAPASACAPAAPEAEARAPWERFLGALAGELARTLGFDLKLAVLSVRAEPREAGSDPGPRFIAALNTALARYAADAPERDLDGALVTPDRGPGARALVLLPDLRRIQDAARLGGRLREELLAGDSPYDDVEIGVAVSPADGQDAVQLVENARAAAESATREGRSELRFHNEAMNRWSFERLALEQGLRDALDQDELVVHYQPKLEVRTRRIVGMEALVRWEHPRLGMISPAQFIPLAEETGLILPIGEWVLRTACRQNREWQERGLPPLRMGVNLSPMQFRDPHLAELVNGVLDETGIDPRWLELELTESMLMEQARATARRLLELKQAGIQLSIDDFGTGYSSLSYLRRFPIDTLKIDRSFVRDVTSNSDDAAIVTSIILMGKSLKLSVIAEGVETESQLAFLEVLDCDEIQGYLISPPQPAERIEEFLRGWS